MLAADERMSEQFTVFGDVVEGLDLAAKFETGDRIEKIVITGQ
jgi:cyclophilin family peptidyl-prolyl cis-trans isomerase